MADKSPSLRVRGGPEAEPAWAACCSAEVKARVDGRLPLPLCGAAGAEVGPRDLSSVPVRPSLAAFHPLGSSIKQSSSKLINS